MLLLYAARDGRAAEAEQLLAVVLMSSWPRAMEYGRC